MQLRWCVSSLARGGSPPTLPSLALTPPPPSLYLSLFPPFTLPSPPLRFLSPPHLLSFFALVAAARSPTTSVSWAGLRLCACCLSFPPWLCSCSVVGLLMVVCVCASSPFVCVSNCPCCCPRPPLITLLVVRTEFPVTAGAALRFCLPCGVSHLLTYLLTTYSMDTIL